jgi:uroporphyrinogen decarboxylase
MRMASWEPDFGRLLTVLRRQGEPDRVPFFDLFFDFQIAEPLLGRPVPADPDEHLAYQVEFMAASGHDFVVARHSYSFPGREGRVADDTAERGTRRNWRDDHHGPIETREDFEQYVWPDVADEHFANIEKLGGLLPDGMKAIPVLPNGPLENLIGLMGYQPLCYALTDDPELVQAVADEIGARELQLYKRLCQYDCIGALALNDDLGFKTQTLIGPEDLRRFIFPWYRRLIDTAHEHGRPVILHACGNCSEVYADVIEDCGIDAKHSFEDVIQPVAEFKRQWGDKCAAMGGIDVDILSRGSQEQVRQYTRVVIEECKPGGGWALGTGNSVTNYMPVGNYYAMLDEGRKHGVY